MGKLEKDSRKNTRRQNIQKIVLASIKISGLMSFALLAPNALIVLKQFEGTSRKRRQNPKYVVNKSIDRLLDKGFITFEKTSRGTFIRLTKRGEEKLRNFDLKKVTPHRKRKKWDKKWRIVIFDVPEKRKVIRNKLRMSLMGIGFLRLQNSVWVYPYDCEDLMMMLKADFKIGKDALYVIADKIENDAVVRRHFGLKR